MSQRASAKNQSTGCSTWGKTWSGFHRLRSVLGLPANRLVYCPGGSVEHFLKSGIRYDLFLFDLDLLNESGFELVRTIRSLAHRQQTPIIVVAANGIDRKSVV